jgi:hypothetical protein
LRLITKFTQIENRETVIEIQNSNASGRVKNQAAKTLSKLPYTGIYTKAVR